jgi:hypothetical protein
MANRRSMPVWMSNSISADVDALNKLPKGSPEWLQAVLALWRRVMVWVTQQNLNYPRPDIAEVLRAVLVAAGAEDEAVSLAQQDKTESVGARIVFERLESDRNIFPMMVIHPETWDDWLEEMLQMRRGGFTPERLGRLYNGEYIVRVDPRMSKFHAQYIEPQIRPRLDNF